MDRIQERITEITQQIPEYVGYQAKERRRESDKLVRRQLAAKYEEQRTRLTRLQRQAPLESVVELENLDQKLQRLIARLNTAPGGYAGWFDAGQIVEQDLDQLTEFDSTLADGVNKVKAALDQVASAVKSKQDVADAINACGDLIDSLNAQFDQREQFLSMGKRPAPANTATAASPLQALQEKKAPPAQEVALGSLRVNDAVTVGGTDYVVAGKMTFAAPNVSFWAFLLQDLGKKQWLRVGPAGDLAVCRELEMSVPSPMPQALTVGDQSFTRQETGTANATVEGAGGSKRGSVSYARYVGSAGERLWLENYGSEQRAMQGEIIDAADLRIYRR